MKALIDADIVIYQVACLHEESYQWDDVTTSQYTDLDGAKVLLDKRIQELKDTINTKEAVLALTSPDNFRYEVLPSYKHNRKNITRPILLDNLREYTLNNYTTRLKPRLEADDVLGILATKYPDTYVICSIDKDLLQIPGTHYNWKHDEFTTVTPEEGNRKFFTQVLTGDSTDGYSGCPSIGKKRAAKLLYNCEDEKEYWKVIVNTYEAKGLTEGDALTQARVARILQCTDYDFKNKEVILWKPNIKGEN